MLRVLVIIFVLLFSSCKRNGGVYEHVFGDKLCELERDFEIRIKEDRDRFISEILWSKVKFGKIFISDRLQHFIAVVNMGGEIERTIGKRGGGPGEIRELSSFDVGDDGFIYIYDIGNKRFSIFDTGGRYISSFIFRSNLIGPVGEIRVKDGKIYFGVIEPEYFDQSKIYKSRRVAVVDTQGNVLHLFGYSDEIYKRFKVYNLRVLASFDKFGNIYVVEEGGTYRIQKYSSDHKLLKVFGHRGRFRELSEDIPWNLPIPKIDELILKYSKAFSIHIVDSLIYCEFVDLTLDGIKRRNPFYHNYYLKVYDLDGNYIPSDLKLPGRVLGVG